MRTTIAATTIAGLVAGLLAPSTLLANTVFDGTWKQDMATGSYSQQPEILSVQGGMFHCETCVPAIAVKADGRDQIVTGHPGFDTMAVTVVNDRTIIETDKKAGKRVSIQILTLGPDGETASAAWTDVGNAGAGPTVTGTTQLVLLSPGPAGAHRLSGSWRVANQTMSDNGALMTFQTEPGQVHFSTPAGLSYVAKLDGTEAPFMGDPHVTAVSVTMPDARRIVEIDKRGGKIVETVTMTVAADGATMSILYDNQTRHRTEDATPRRNYACRMRDGTHAAQPRRRVAAGGLSVRSGYQGVSLSIC